MKILAGPCIALLLLAGASAVPARAQEVAGNAAVSGAGSTFAFPIIAKWAAGYQRWKAGGGDYQVSGGGLDDAMTGRAVDYEPSGSLAGTLRARDGSVDFGASDVPLNSAELTKLGLGQFPIVIGGVAIVVNLDGVAAGDIKFTGPLLADIFLGKVADLERSGDQGDQSDRKTSRREDRGHPPQRRLRHHLQLHQLSFEGERGVEGQGRLGSVRQVAGRRGREGQ